MILYRFFEAKKGWVDLLDLCCEEKAITIEIYKRQIQSSFIRQ